MTDLKTLQSLLKFIDTEELRERFNGVYNSVTELHNNLGNVIEELGAKIDDGLDLLDQFVTQQSTEASTQSVWDEAVAQANKDVGLTPDPATPTDFSGYEEGDWEGMADYVARNHPEAEVRHGWEPHGPFKVSFDYAIENNVLRSAWENRLGQRFAEASQAKAQGL